MSYAQQFTLMDSNLFRGRVMMSMMAAATNVVAEDVGTAEHAARLALAERVLSNPGEQVYKFLYAVASNVAIAAAGESASLDGDLDFVIASNWTQKALEFIP